MGTYISQDPLSVWGGLAVYGYVSNTLVQIDPLGLSGIDGLVRYSPSKVSPLIGGRSTAISRAWSQEKQLIELTGSGTKNWTQFEIDLIRRTPDSQLTSTMSRAGYTGHHINSVEGNGMLGHNWKGDPRNIVFLENHNHPNGVNNHVHGLQGHRGNTQNATRGRLIDRQSMIDQHHKSVAASCP